MNTRGVIDTWLFRLRGPEPSPIVLVQRRVFVLPTAAGLAYGIVLLLMLIGSINYNLSLGYLLTFLLGGLGVVTILHTFANLAQLVIEPGRAEPVTAGERAHFQLHFSSDKERFALEVLCGDQTQLVHVGAGTSQQVDVALRSSRRGWLRPGRITIATRFPLGLVRAWSYIEPDQRCLIYPAPEASAPPLPLPENSQGDGLAGGSGSDDFAGLRSHQLADSPRHVAWKAVARGSPMLTKQFSGHGATRLWLNWHDLPRGLDLDSRLSRLTAWLLAARRAGLACGLRIPGREWPPAVGDAHSHDCLKALALFGLGDQDD